MPTKAIAILLLAFLGPWLNVILPGHTRGVVTLPSPGDEPARVLVAAGSCCQPPAPEQPESDGEGGRRGKAARCALCFFAGMLAQAGWINLLPPPPQRVGLAPVQLAVSADAPLLLSYRGRAPPAI